MGTTRRQTRDSSVRNDFHAIENRQKRVPLALPELKRFLMRAHREMGLPRDAAFVCFLTDAEMTRLNRSFRSKPKTTDVLSFPSQTRHKPRSLRTTARKLRGSFLGDIAISPVVARRNAKQFGRSTTAEICVLMLHGLLHLLGYDHETDRGEMARVEAKLRSRLGLS
jgi:probable rRNA maturation factor